MYPWKCAQNNLAQSAKLERHTRPIESINTRHRWAGNHVPAGNQGTTYLAPLSRESCTRREPGNNVRGAAEQGTMFPIRWIHQHYGLLSRGPHILPELFNPSQQSLSNQSINVPFHQRYKTGYWSEFRNNWNLISEEKENGREFKTNPSSQCLCTKKSLVTVWKRAGKWRDEWWRVDYSVFLGLWSKTCPPPI